MWSLIITAIAICSVAALYAWAAYRWQEQREEALVEQTEVESEALQPVDGSDWELEYLMTADYAR
jgi:hypothetical protein